MAEITKVTTPMIPRENVGSKNRPATEQTFELNNPGKVNKPTHDNRIMDREAGGQPLNMGKGVLQPLLKDVGELMYNIHKMVALLELGISTSDVLRDPQVAELLEQLFATPEELVQLLQEQDQAAVLFKGDAFDVLRDIVARFSHHEPVKEAVVELLKTFEYNVNYQNSVKSILYNCENLLDYMFSGDRQQFSSYLDGLTEMLMPEWFAAEEEAQQPHPQARQTEGQTTVEMQKQFQSQPVLDASGKPVVDAQGKPVTQAPELPELTETTVEAPLQMDQKEAAQVLKNNLLPLLGEIVVKYHQNGRIRDIVMVVVHNIVRVDKGSAEALREAVRDLAAELNKVAHLPEKFQQELARTMEQAVQGSRQTANKVMEQLTEMISKTLHDPEGRTPNALRQAENLLLSLLQNQSSMMDVLHFMLPMQMPDDRLFAELYVDPESDEGKGKPGDSCRKLFLSVESESHGIMELCFVQSGERVDFSMWCPGVLVDAMSGLRRTVGDIMQTHGYSMSGFRVQEMQRPHTIADVFPKLLNRKVGIDVRV